MFNILSFFSLSKHMKEKISCSSMDDTGPCWVRILVVQECLLRVGVAAQLGFSPVGTPVTLWIPSVFVSVPELWSEGHCFYVRRSRAQAWEWEIVIWCSSCQRKGQGQIGTLDFFTVCASLTVLKKPVWLIYSLILLLRVSLSFKVSTEILENWFI